MWIICYSTNASKEKQSVTVVPTLSTNATEPAWTRIPFYPLRSLNINGKCVSTPDGNFKVRNLKHTQPSVSRQWMTELLKHSFVSTFEAQQIDAKYRPTDLCVQHIWTAIAKLALWRTVACNETLIHHCIPQSMQASQPWMEAICPTSEHAVTPYFFKIYYPSIYC